MKWLFILALIANIAFFIYNQFAYEQPLVTVEKKINPSEHSIILLRELTAAQIEQMNTTPDNSIAVNSSDSSSVTSDVLNTNQYNETPDQRDKIGENEVETPPFLSDDTSTQVQSVTTHSVPENEPEINKLQTEALTVNENKSAIESPKQGDIDQETDVNESAVIHAEVSTATNDNMADEEKLANNEKIKADETLIMHDESAINKQKNSAPDDSGTDNKTENTPLASRQTRTTEVSSIPEVLPLDDKLIETFLARIDQEAEVTEEHAAGSKNIIASRRNKSTHTCFNIGPFSKSRLEEIKREMEKQFPNRISYEITTTSEVTYYRIYIPPLNSSEEIASTLKTLDQHGLKDHYVMSINGRKNAIAIGVFKKRQAAEQVAIMARFSGFQATIEAITNAENSLYNLILDFNDSGDVPEFRQKMEQDAQEYKACGN